jgi:hypothetical protein
VSKRRARRLPSGSIIPGVSEIASTLFQLIAVAVLCALVWSLPERSREARRQRTTGTRSPRW